MRTFTTSTHRRFFPALLLAGLAAVAACSTQVETTPTSSGTGTGGTTSSSIAASTTTSSSTGGSGSLGPLACAPGEGAIVVGSSYDQASVSVLNDGAWIEDATSFPAPQLTAAYVDVYNRLGVFWTSHALDVESAHYLTTKDGASFDTHDVPTWAPPAYIPLFSIGTYGLAGRDNQGLTTARYDADAMNWYPWAATKFEAMSGAALATSPDIVFIGVNDSYELCDLTLIAGDSFGPTSCHPELKVWLGDDLPAPPPKLVALPDGDAVAIYATSFVDITAVVLHDGKWSSPVTAALPQFMYSFAAAVAPSGDVLVGMTGGASQLHAMRFSPGAGWGATILIADGAHIPAQDIAAAPGICGDDALFAYATDEANGEIRVARVRGSASATTKVGSLVNAVPTRLSLATRPSNVSL
jgi:hypothetical protein